MDSNMRSIGEVSVFEIVMELFGTMFYAMCVSYKLWKGGRKVWFDDYDKLPVEGRARRMGVRSLFRCYFTELYVVLCQIQYKLEKLSDYAESGKWKIGNEFPILLRNGAFDYKGRVPYELIVPAIITQDDVSFLKEDIHLGKGEFGSLMIMPKTTVKVKFHCDDAIIDSFHADESVYFSEGMTYDSMKHEVVERCSFRCNGFIDVSEYVYEDFEYMYEDDDIVNT
jgi:hypothetical protein